METLKSFLEAPAKILLGVAPGNSMEDLPKIHLEISSGMPLGIPSGIPLGVLLEFILKILWDT